MASGKVPPLGCNFTRHPSHLTSRRYIKDSRSGSGTGSQSQSGKISRTYSQIPLHTVSCGDTQSNEQRSREFLVWSWVTNQKDHSQSSQNQSYFPKNFGSGATGNALSSAGCFSEVSSWDWLFLFVCGDLRSWNCWTSILNWLYRILNYKLNCLIKN